MPRASSSRWKHWLASSILLVLYCPSNVLTPALVADLVVQADTLFHPWFVVWLLLSCGFVNASLVLTTFAARRVKPRTLLLLRVFLLVYALPHMLLVSVVAPLCLPDAWIV